MKKLLLFIGVLGCVGLFQKSVPLFESEKVAALSQEQIEQLVAKELDTEKLSKKIQATKRKTDQYKLILSTPHYAMLFFCNNELDNLSLNREWSVSWGKNIYKKAFEYYEGLDLEVKSHPKMAQKFQSLCHSYLEFLYENEEGNRKEIAEFSEKIECFERAANAYEKIGFSKKANEMKEKEQKKSETAQKKLIEDLNRETPLDSRGNLTSLLNQERMNEFIEVFKKRINGEDFKTNFPNAAFTEQWFEKMKQLCLEETELDFQTKTLFNPLLYNAAEKENQVAFEFGCSFIVQILSKCIQDCQLDFSSSKQYEDFIAEAFHLRFLIQKTSQGEDARKFWTKWDENMDPLKDPLTTILNPERILYLRKLLSSEKTLKNLTSEYGDEAFITILAKNGFPDSCIDEFSEITHVHCKKAYNGQELFRQFYRLENTDKEEIKKAILTFYFNFSRSSTYNRGQGAVSIILARTLLNTKGYRLLHLRKWHVNSSLFPHDVDAFYSSTAEEYILENAGCLKMEKYKDTLLKKLKEMNTVQSSDSYTKKQRKNTLLFSSPKKP